jgi:site-specific DNA-methyltransferase (adenine-specific)
MPESLLERIIKTSSNENNLVFDPFGGTGTTAYVAKKLKRNYITMDISEKYFEVIQKRLNGQLEEIKRESAYNKLNKPKEVTLKLFE